MGGLAREGSRRDRGAIGAPHPCSSDKLQQKSGPPLSHDIIYIDVPERWVTTSIICLVDTSKKTGPVGGRIADRDAPKLATMLQLLLHTPRG